MCVQLSSLVDLCVPSSTNPCAITRSLYLEVLNTLFELVGCEGGGVALLEGDEVHLQLRSLHAHSLDVCRSCQHQSSVLQHVRLLVTAMQCSSIFHSHHHGSHEPSHDLSHDLSHVPEVVLGVLGWTKERTVVTYVLESSRLLEGGMEEGRGERALETLVLRGLKDSDPDILSVVSFQVCCYAKLTVPLTLPLGLQLYCHGNCDQKGSETQ